MFLLQFVQHEQLHKRTPEGICRPRRRICFVGNTSVDYTVVRQVPEEEKDGKEVRCIH